MHAESHTPHSRRPPRAGGRVDYFADARDAGIKTVALVVALVLHLVALTVNLPDLRRAVTVERPRTVPTFVRRYVPPPPPETVRRLPARKQARRLLPVPDPTPDLPEPVLEPEPELEFAMPDAPEIGDWLGVPEAPPAPRGSRPGTPQQPRLAGVAGVTNPVLIGDSYVRPEYPEIARLARKEADVVLSAIVTREGSVEHAEILRCTAPAYGFEEAALAAVTQWRYLPATQDGEPVAVYFTILVEFDLL